MQTPKCSGMRKPALVNMVSKLYGDGSSQQTAHKSPPSLKYLTERYIKQWPIAAVNVAYSQMMFPHALQVWEKENCFSGTWTLHVENGHSFTIPRWYAQPATMEGNNVQTIVDPHHIYVNNRTRCCSKGMSKMGIRANAWWEVAENNQQNQTGLSVELAVELRDRQRNEYAEPTFSEEVQSEMLRLGYHNEAEWCALIRNWYHSCDEAGVDVEQRVEWMLDMRGHLLKYAHIGQFPPPGAYVGDKPLAQYEGILTNIDRRLQLYHMVEHTTYNQRAVSTLDSENFFGAFQVYIYICIIYIIEQ